LSTTTTSKWLSALAGADAIACAACLGPRLHLQTAGAYPKSHDPHLGNHCLPHSALAGQKPHDHVPHRCCMWHAPFPLQALRQTRRKSHHMHPVPMSHNTKSQTLCNETGRACIPAEP
jgi:hypothetical protein